jgi:peptidoglycan hydrolase-like protein with peptidoglycan-binding domain
MAAVKAFQTAAGLKADGIAGPVTLAAIDQRLSAKR